MMKIENSMERQKRKSAAQLNVVAYSVVILSGVLLVTSGGFALSSKHKTIRREIVAQEESDLRVRDINHFLDEVPKCIVSQLSLPSGISALINIRRELRCSQFLYKEHLLIMFWDSRAVYFLEFFNKAARIRIRVVYVEIYDP